MAVVGRMYAKPPLRVLEQSGALFHGSAQRTPISIIGAAIFVGGSSASSGS